MKNILNYIYTLSTSVILLLGKLKAFPGMRRRD